MSYNILAISGSKRKNSYNTALVRAFKALAPEGVTIEIADLSAIPFYDQDTESSFPASVIEIKEKIQASDGIIVSTPEYNRSMPGFLKNAIDWTSRPYGQGAWNGKPVLVVGATMAHTGTALAQYHLKQSLLFMNAMVPGQPEFYVSGAQDKFDAEGNLTDEDTKNHIISAFAAFTAFIDKVK